MARLRDLAPLGAAEVARRLGRSVASVKKAAQRERISLRPAGERRGHVLGQLRDMRLDAEMRRDLLRRRSDEGDDPDAPICPACGRRPQQVPSTGLCRPCHRSRLTEKHREHLEDVESQRELWKARQQVKRARDKVEALS